MKKWLSLWLVMALCLSVVPSYAAGIDANALKALNLVNFSVAANDKSAEAKKWVKSNFKEDDDNAVNVLNHGRENFIPASTPYQVYVTRNVVQNWTAKGKADPKLGSCYTSKVNLAVITSQVYYNTLTTEAWVKKTGNKYTITKVTYVLVDRQPTAAETKAEEKNDKLIYFNGYPYFLALYEMVQPYVDMADTDIVSQYKTDQGLEITVDPSDSFIAAGAPVCMVDTKANDISQGYVFAEVTTDTAKTIKANYAILGLKNYMPDHSPYLEVIDKATGESVKNEDGLVELKPGVTYQFAIVVDTALVKEKSLFIVWNTEGDYVE